MGRHPVVPLDVLTDNCGLIPALLLPEDRYSSEIPARGRIAGDHEDWVLTHCSVVNGTSEMEQPHIHVSRHRCRATCHHRFAHRDAEGYMLMNHRHDGGRRVPNVPRLDGCFLKTGQIIATHQPQVIHTGESDRGQDAFRCFADV